MEDCRDVPGPLLGGPLATPSLRRRPGSDTGSNASAGSHTAAAAVVAAVALVTLGLLAAPILRDQAQQLAGPSWRSLQLMGSGGGSSSGDADDPAISDAAKWERSPGSTFVAPHSQCTVYANGTHAQLGRARGARDVALIPPTAAPLRRRCSAGAAAARRPPAVSGRPRPRTAAAPGAGVRALQRRQVRRAAPAAQVLRRVPVRLPFLCQAVPGTEPVGAGADGLHGARPCAAGAQACPRAGSSQRQLHGRQGAAGRAWWHHTWLYVPLLSGFPAP